MLTATGITVTRGGKDLLAGVSLSLRPGEVSAVLGPNGAGKSTLLRVLTGAMAPEAGTVEMDGVAVHALSSGELARRRAVLSQESHLQFDFTVEEVVLLGRIPHLSGWESARDRAACERAIRAADLAELRERRYPTLSGGEKQRVHFARVLAQLDRDEHGGHAPWLFLDEPTSALDLRHQHATLQRVRALAHERGFGICAVLHDLNLALAYAERAVLLSQGTVFAQGAVGETLTAENVSAVFGVEAELCTTSGPSFLRTQPIASPHE